MTQPDLHYLEIVTPDVDATCQLYARSLGATFGGPEPALGQAAVATLPSGSLVGVRAPMHAMETPVVRLYARVPDLAEAVAAARALGAEILLESMELPGHGHIAIHSLGGIEHGLWQVG